MDKLMVRILVVYYSSLLWLASSRVEGREHWQAADVFSRLA